MEDLASYGSDLYAAFELLGKAYRQSDCYDMCYQTFVTRVCGCMDATFYPLPGSAYPFCLNVSQLVCDLNSFLYFFSNQELKAQCEPRCPLECESQTFKLTISSSDFPTRAYANQLVNHSSLLDRFYANASLVTYEQLKSNLLALEIYYADMKYTYIEEIEKTSFLDLVAGVGGTLGLFIGMSFLSFLEVADVLIECAYVLIRRKIINSANNRVVMVKPAPC